MIFPWNKPDLDRLLERRHVLPHALLIRGPRGIGKLALAEALVRALLCEQPRPDGSACDRCRACEWMGQGSHPDFRRLEPRDTEESDEEGDRRKRASTQITIDSVRALGDFLSVSSHRGGRKIVLIHPAEALNVAAANALLKSVEEPPPATHFVLVSHRWHQLPPTLKSRCEQIPLTLPDPAQALAWLKAQGVDEPQLALAHAGGAPLIAAELDGEYWAARRAFYVQLARPSIDPLVIARNLGDARPDQVVGWMQKWAHDLVCCALAGTVRYNPDFEQPIAAAARRIGRVDAVRFGRRMMRLQRIVNHPLNARLFLEDVLIEYAALLRGEVPTHMQEA